MSKTLNLLIEDAKRERIALRELLPGVIDRYMAGMRAQIGIDGVLTRDLKDDFEDGGHQFTTTQIKTALKELGWESFNTLIPGRSKRVRVWVRRGQRPQEIRDTDLSLTRFQ